MALDPRIKQLLDRWDDAHEAGQTPTPEEHCRDCPELIGPFRQLLQRLAQIDGLKAPPRSGHPVPLAPGTWIKGTEIVRELGQGGMGTVFLARQPGLNRYVAMKVIKAGVADQQALARFMAEARAAATVKHAHVVQVYECGELATGPYLMMEYLPGATLADRLRSNPLVEALVTAELVRQIASGVGAIHANGIVHRDLKPGNVLFDENDVPKVSDFGLAKMAGSELTHTGDFLGTPAYMAPEQVEGKVKSVGPPADIWALGVVLYQCLTGERPFSAAEMWSLVDQIRNKTPASPASLNPTVPLDLCKICLKCLSKDPSDRYPTASALADDLARHLADEQVVAAPPRMAKRMQRFARRNRMALIIGIAAAVVLATGLVAQGLIARQNDYSRRVERVNRSLAADDWSPDHVAGVTEDLAAIDRVSPPAAAEFRARIVQKLNATLDDLFGSPQLTDEHQHRMDDTIRILRSLDVRLADLAAGKRVEKFKDWRVAARLDVPFDKYNKYFAPSDRLTATPSGLAWAAPPGVTYLPSTIEVGPNVQVEAKFDAPRPGQIVGISFDTGEGRDIATAIAASPAAPMLAIGYRSGDIELRHADTNKTLSIHRVRVGEVSSLSFDSRGSRLLVTTLSGVAVVCEVKESRFAGEAVRRTCSDQAIVMGTLSPDGKVFAMRVRSGRVLVYDSASPERLIDVTPEHFGFSFSSGVFTSDGRHLILPAHTEIRCEDWRAPKERRTKWMHHEHSNAGIRLGSARAGKDEVIVSLSSTGQIIQSDGATGEILSNTSVSGLMLGQTPCFSLSHGSDQVVLLDRVGVAKVIKRASFSLYGELTAIPVEVCFGGGCDIPLDAVRGHDSRSHFVLFQSGSVRRYDVTTQAVTDLVFRSRYSVYIQRDIASPERSDSAVAGSLRLTRNRIAVRVERLSKVEKQVRLHVRREGSRLTVRTDHGNAINFTDVVPSPPDPTVLGLVGSERINVRSLQISTRETAGQLFDVAEEHYSRGDFGQALAAYTKLRGSPPALGRDDLLREAVCKSGICSQRLRCHAEAAELFRSLSAQAAPRDRWATIAAGLLIAHHEQRGAVAEAISQANLLLEDQPGVLRDTVLHHLPDYLLVKIKWLLTTHEKTGDVYFFPDARRVQTLASLNRLYRVIQGKAPRQAALALIGAHRLRGSHREAVSAARDLLAEHPPPRGDQGDRTAWYSFLDTTEEYYFVVRTYGDPAAAVSTIPVTRDGQRFWLWIELARMHIANRDPAGARLALNELWRVHGGHKFASLNDDSLSELYLTYATGKLISGFLYFDAGDPAAAKKEWASATFEAWKRSFTAAIKPMRKIDNLLHLQDWLQERDELAKGLAGLGEGSERLNFVRSVLTSPQFNPSRQAILERFPKGSPSGLDWGGAVGRGVARHFAYRTVTYHELNRKIVAFAAYCTILDEAKLTGLSDSNKQLLFEAVETLLPWIVTDGQKGRHLVPALLRAWDGDLGPDGWAAIKERIPVEHRGLVVWLLGKRLEKVLGPKSSSAALLVEAAKDPHTPATFHPLVRGR